MITTESSQRCPLAQWLWYTSNEGKDVEILYQRTVSLDISFLGTSNSVYKPPSSPCVIPTHQEDGSSMRRGASHQSGGKRPGERPALPTGAYNQRLVKANRFVVSLMPYVSLFAAGEKLRIRSTAMPSLVIRSLRLPANS